MTDRDLKKSFKKLGIIFAVMGVLIVILSVYTLSSTKTELSIYDKSECSNNLQALGINEDEFKKYLSIFGNLIIESSNENEQNLNMISEFIDEMCPIYEAIIDESGLKCYDAEIVNNIAKELKGQGINKKSYDVNTNYIYNEEKNSYIQSKNLKEKTVCNKIDNITKNGDKIDVTYELIVMDSEKLVSENEENLKKYKVKAIILNNLEYEYSKYFVSDIEKIKDC